MPDKSTTGRSLPFQLRAAGLGLRALGAVAPRATDRLLTRMFGTPRRRPAGEPRLTGAEPPTPRAIRVRFDDRRSLAAWSWGEGPRVLLAHGWEGSAGDFATLAASLVARGYEVVAFDMPAHGRSDGRRTILPEMAQAVHRVADAVGGAHAAVGHSLGGAALALALRDGLRVTAAALVAPPSGPIRYVGRLTSALGLPEARRQGVIDEIRRILGGDLSAIDVPTAARALDVPALIVHDRGDREVPFDEGKAIADAWPRARLVPTEGLGHRRLLAASDVIDEIAGFLAAPVARPPRRGAALPSVRPARAAGEVRAPR